ncbi:MAG TPA: sirohydrochlorin chelatase [Actinospica sp.]|nr:sirohydrochlorin chelatase [Actinospica sp.]
MVGGFLTRNGTAPAVLPPARDDVPLIAVAHGTAHQPGLRTLEALVERLRFLRPGLEVRLGFVSAAAPRPVELLAGLAEEGAREAVVLPVFLGSGYHVAHDIPEAVRSAATLRVHTARPLGPDPALAQVLAERLGAVAGRVFGTQVVLVAAGSQSRRANTDTFVMAAMLSERLGMQVSTAFLTAAEPSAAEVLTRLARRGRPVAVASYLLAEGGYTQRLADTAALAGLEPEAARTPRVAGPLGAHELVARLLLRRYDEALFG